MLRTLRGALVGTLVAATLATSAPAIEAQVACVFTMGFKALRDMIPEVVGDCLENEKFNTANGNGEQRTRGGLLVWRKADNWTAFTNGSITWINGPAGLASRPNTGPLFPWEVAGPAQTDGLDLKQIALQASDLPTGFFLRKGAVRPLMVSGEQVGELYESEWGRQGGGAAALNGPMEVRQLLVRSDRPIPTADQLGEVGKHLGSQLGVQKSNDGPNDRERLTLVKREGVTATFAHAVIKGNVVVATAISGISPPVDANLAVEYNNKSLDRLKTATGGR